MVSSRMHDPGSAPAAPSIRFRNPLLLALLLWLPLVVVRDAWPVDETRYAEIALGMEESGEWWVPRFDGAWYAEKPPLFFWAIAAASKAGVPLDRAPMAVSLLASLLTIALLPTIARACGLSDATARRAGYLFATAPLVAIYAQAGYLDPLLTCTITAATACALARTTRPREERGVRVGLALLEGVALAAALLTKGPVALLFAAALRVGAAMAAKDGTERVPGRTERLDLVVGAVAVALALAWCFKARAVAGAEYVDALLFGQIERRVAGTETKHHRIAGYALLIVVVGALPWSVLALGALPRLRRSAWRPPPRLAALAGGALLPTTLIALLPTQQPHYVLPAMPLFALLAGELLARPSRRFAVRAAATTGIVVGAALVAAAIALRVGGMAERLVDGEIAAALEGDGALAAVFAATGVALLGVVAWPAGAGGANVGLRAVAGGAAFFLMLPLLAPRLERFVTAAELLAAPALHDAKRIAAPSALHSSLRLSTRLPRIDDLGRKPWGPRLRADPGRVVVSWEDERAEHGLLDGVEVVARGWVRGRRVVALRAAP